MHIQSIVFCVWLAVLLPANAMFLVPKKSTSTQRIKQALKVRYHSTANPRKNKKCNDKAFNTSAADLRACIVKPDFFSSIDVQDIIAETLPNPNDTGFMGEQDLTCVVDPCRMNGILHYIVQQAKRYPEKENQYADVIWSLRWHGWELSKDCCMKTMMHDAIEHNLLGVAKALNAYVYKNEPTILDKKKRTPLHYVKSVEVADWLLMHIQRCDINAQDIDGNTPLHLAPAQVVVSLLKNGACPDIENNEYFVGYLYQTPLRKAVAEADASKCRVFLQLSCMKPTSKELSWLSDYARTCLHVATTMGNNIDTERYRKIVSLLEEAK